MKITQLTTSLLFVATALIPSLGYAERILDTGNRADTIFVSTEGKQEHVSIMTNLFGSSLTYGVWSNKIINGSGNNSMLGKNPLPEGYFSQMLRTISLFDLYFTSGVLRLQSQMAPDEMASLVLVAGAVGADYAASLPSPNIEIFGRNILSGMVDLGPFSRFSVREIPDGAIKFNKGRAMFPATVFRKEFGQGLAFRYWGLKEKAQMGNANILEKVMAQNALFWPTGFLASIHVEPAIKKSSKARYVLLMAAPGELVTPDKDPRTWEIVPVAKKLEKPLDTEFAQVDSVVYEGAGRAQRDNLSLLRIETQKDFNNPDVMEVVLAFGHQGSDDSKDFVAVNHRIPNEALRVRGHLKWRELERSKVGDFKIVKKVTDYVRTLQIEVGFHQLALSLVREPMKGTAKEIFEANPTFNVKYNPSQSLLSYRIYKMAEKDEANSLSKIGFECKTDGAKYLCERFFWSAKELGQSFFKDFSGGLISGIFSKIVGKVTKDTFAEELPEVASELNEQLAKIVLKLIEDGQKAKEMTSKLLPESPINSASLLLGQ